MRKTWFILITLAFTAVLSVSKTNTHIAAAKLSLSYDMTITHAQKKISASIKDNLLTSYFQENGDLEDDNFDKEVDNKYKEKSALFTSLTMHNSASFVVIENLNYKKNYGNPYNTLIQLPIYILHHALIIPFS
ncbi:hypothetical protein AR687_11065 [Flavobacteriaceae bacterium CRH]|nr:hypothetical protein AR687_11065 [Flavobacteriaceae bacterium CRH]